MTYLISSFDIIKQIIISQHLSGVILRNIIQDMNIVMFPWLNRAGFDFGIVTLLKMFLTSLINVMSAK